MVSERKYPKSIAENFILLIMMLYREAIKSDICSWSDFHVKILRESPFSLRGAIR